MFFFPFLFLSYCHSVVHRVVSIVSDDSKQSSFVCFDVVFESLYQCVNAVFDAGKSSPSSFLDTYSLSTSSLRCVLCMVISFLLLCSSLVHFRKGSEYLTRGATLVLIPLIRFLQESFVLRSFLVLLPYSFWILSFISTCLIESASNMPKYLEVWFSPCVLILSWFGSSIPSVRCRLQFFITNMVHFSMPYSYPMSWLYILFTCIRVSSSFSFYANSLMSSMYIRYIRWLTPTCDLLSLYPAAHFLSMWLSGIMAIMICKSASASPWKIPLWIFASAKLLPPALNSTLQIFMVLSIKFITSCDILYFLKQIIIQLCGTISYPFFVVNPGHS